MNAQTPLKNRQPLLAFIWAVPISLLGGPMGLGGAEFRLPALAGPLGYQAKQAVPLNLAVSLVMIVVSLLIRGHTLPLVDLLRVRPVLASLITGAAITAYLGASWVRRISNEQLERIIDIKSAGTGSLMVSLPTVMIGLIRYARSGAFADPQPLRETVAPVGVGSVIGALLGGLLVGIIPSSALKLILGLILILSAIRVFAHTHSSS